jgi:FkbM family methyltransferase
VLVEDFDGDLSFKLDLGEHMQRRIFWMGYCNLDVVPLLKSLLKPQMVYVDVGANVGELALVSAKLVGPEGRVVAFEPVTATADRLRENLSSNDMAWVEVVEKGLSDEVGLFPIYRPEDFASLSGEVNNGLPSLFAGGLTGSEIQKVELSTMDLFFESASQLDVLKIDIEGAELACLRGGVRTISRLRPHIIIEVQEETAHMAGYSPRDVLELLSTLHYEFFSIGRKGKLAPVQSDTLDGSQNVLCVPKAV